MAVEYRDEYRREGTLAAIEAQAHLRLLFYANSMNAGTGTYSYNAEDTGAFGFYDNNFTVGAPNPDITRHFLFTLDSQLNPQIPIGENGIHFRHSTTPATSDLDLILVDNVPGTRASWPKLWWDYDVTYPNFSFGVVTTNPVRVHINDTLYVNGSQGIGIKAPSAGSLLEVYSLTADSIVTITSADATHNPQIVFRTAASPAVRAIIGVDNTDDTLRFNVGNPAVLDMSTQFKMDSNGYIGLGLPTTTTANSLIHLHIATAGGVDAVANTALTLENSTNVYLQFLAPDASSAGAYFGSPTNTNIYAFFYFNNSTKYFNFQIDSNDILRINSLQQVGVNVNPGTNSTAHFLNLASGAALGITWPAYTALGLEGNSAVHLGLAASSDHYIEFINGASTIVSSIGINATGRVTIKADGTTTESLVIGIDGIGVGGAGYNSAYTGYFARGPGSPTQVRIDQGDTDGAYAPLCLKQDDTAYSIFDFYTNDLLTGDNTFSTDAGGGGAYGFLKVRVRQAGGGGWIEKWITVEDASA